MASASEFLQDVVRKINDQPQRSGISAATYHFVLTGEGGGTWTLSISGGQARLEEGAKGTPNTTIEMSAADSQELAARRLSPVSAYMSGRLRIQGDLGLAMRLQPYLS